MCSQSTKVLHAKGNFLKIIERKPFSYGRIQESVYLLKTVCEMVSYLHRNMHLPPGSKFG